jgi:propionate CoA-transferase
MNLSTKLHCLWRILRWRMAFGKYDPDHKPEGDLSPKFMSARQAAALVRDGACVLSTGMAGNGRCKAFYFALRDEFRRSGHPRGLTWMGVGAIGGRGRVPGTVEDLALPGLITRYIGGHIETAKALRKLAAEGVLEMQTLPQGVMALLLEAQGEGTSSLLTATGLGTFLDPAEGGGTRVVPGVGESLVEREGHALRFRLPAVDVAIFMASSADAEGNLYMDGATSLTENLEAARAARRNGGLVLAGVGRIRPKNEAEVFLAAEGVDAVVLDPYAEQTACYFTRDPWKALTTRCDIPVRQATEQVAFINGVLGITPRRHREDRALARMAADLFSRAVRPGAMANIGVGLPEEVCREIAVAGLAGDVTFIVETGALGGFPAAGVFFGSAIAPKRLLSSAQGFRLCQERLDVTVLGFLQVDGEGNVNVSRRGEGPMGFVGPGGFPDIVCSARILIFVGTWMSGGELSVAGGHLRIFKRGRHKFVRRVDEVTLNGREALARGAQVWFVTNVGIFKLEERGLVLVALAPGANLERDVLCAPPAIHLPTTGPIPVLDPSVLTGKGFQLAWAPETPWDTPRPDPELVGVGAAERP